MPLFSKKPQTAIEFQKLVEGKIAGKNLNGFKKVLSNYIHLLNKKDSQSIINEIVYKIDSKLSPEKAVDFYGAFMFELDKRFGSYLNDYITYLPFIDSLIKSENKLILGEKGLFAAVSKLVCDYHLKFEYKPSTTGNMKYHNELTALYIKNYIKRTNWISSENFWMNANKYISPENTVPLFSELSKIGIDVYNKNNYLNVNIFKYILIPHMNKYGINNKSINDIIIKLPKDYYGISKDDAIEFIQILKNASKDNLKKLKEILNVSDIKNYNHNNSGGNEIILKEIDKLLIEKQEKLKDASKKSLELKFGIKTGEQFGGIKADKKAEKFIADKKHQFKINSARVVAKGEKQELVKVFDTIKSQYPEMKEDIVKLALSYKKRTNGGK